MSYQRYKTGNKNFTIKLLIFLLTVTVADFVMGKILKRTYWQQRQGYDYLTTYSIEKTEAHILVFGSSRAVNIFDPRILKDELGTTCFNAGRVGQSVFYHYAVLKAALKRYTPDVVILSLDAGDFAKERGDYDRISQLLPYYELHPEIRDVIGLKSPFEPLKMLSSIYPYNSLMLPIVKGNLKKKSQEYSVDGFIPLRKKLTGPLHKFNYSDYSQLDSNKISVYKSFISECRNAGIRLFVVCPPYMEYAVGRDKSLLLAKNIARQNSIDFFDYSDDPAYTGRRDYFADFRHLNDQGAGIFSKQVANRIRIVGEIESAGL